MCDWHVSQPVTLCHMSCRTGFVPVLFHLSSTRAAPSFSKSSHSFSFRRLKVMSISVLETGLFHCIHWHVIEHVGLLNCMKETYQMENFLNMLWYHIKDRSGLDDLPRSRNIILVVWSGHQVVDVTKKTLSPQARLITWKVILIIGPFLVKDMTFFMNLNIWTQLSLHVCFILFILQ